jgi:thioredoxin reductase (NADPH)
MVESEAPGGQAGQSSRIDNYLGFPSGLSGSDLARRATTQARRLGTELLSAGLGLDTARRIIVDLHHGSLSLESRTEHPTGTIFRARFPLHAGH